FHIAGFSPNLLYVWPIVCGGGIVLAEYALVREAADETIALATAAVFALAPSQFLLNTLNAGGGFGMALLMQLVALWLCVRLYRSDTPDPHTWLAFCALSGLVCWLWQLYIPLLPVLLALLWLRKMPLDRGTVAAGALLIVVFSSPFWLYNIAYSGASFAK